MDILPTSPDQAATLVWSVSLLIGLIVSLVVAALLWLIHRTASRIDAAVATIWEVGQRVANNTVHIPALYKTNALAAGILDTALKINAAAAAIESHADGCPGCPQCMLQHRRGTR